MKARVIREFIDKYTQEFHAVGEEISLTAERYSEIEKAGAYVVTIKQDEPVEQNEPVQEPKTTKKTRRSRK